MSPSGPIDPATSAPVALRGRIVTMDSGGTVLPDGVLYAKDGSIVAVNPASEPAPVGFEDVAVSATGATLFPGLIELHNHLPYDVLSLWQVPAAYTNRDQWAARPEYRRLITGPMKAIAAQGQLPFAIIRFVEVRCLLGGTTTSQGFTLAADTGIISHFKGLVRNVENAGDPDLPNAATHIADVEAKDWASFKARISRGQKMILHLAEGIDTPAHTHFAALHGPDGTWAITKDLVGIHCVGLKPADFAVFANHGGSMVWSPFSNLLLYGQTADLAAAFEAKVPVALGSDWSPSGSKNLLGELKVARLAAPLSGAAVSDEQLVAMATTTPARMLGWSDHLGSLEVGKRADAMVVSGAAGDPHTALVDATEADVELVVINGVPRAGTPALMGALGLAGGETVQVGGRPRVLNLAQTGADPGVAALSVAEAQSLLSGALGALGGTTKSGLATVAPGTTRLAVEGLVDNGMVSRHHLPYQGKPTGPDLPGRGLAAPTPVPLSPLTLEPLTAVDNPAFYETIAAEQNLPPAVRDGLAKFKP